MKLKIAKLLPIPLMLLAISLFGIYQVYSKTGDFFLRDIDLKGGTSITLIFNKSITTGEIEPILKNQIEKFILSSSKTAEGYTSITILTEKSIDASTIVNLLNSNGLYPIEYSVQFVGPELGSAFFSQVSALLTVAYILLFLTNLFIYKRLTIAFTIVLSSLANIIAVFGLMNLFNQKISFAGFSSILMLIAFAIDTNVILATKILSGKIEEFYDQYKKGLITGLTINAGLIISMLIVLLFSNSSFLINIAQIQIIGFTADIINTWILNAAIIEVVLLGKRH
jgi:preprotein translocase subunit SecF